jgi:hypothetical protein
MQGAVPGVERKSPTRRAALAAEIASAPSAATYPAGMPRNPSVATPGLKAPAVVVAARQRLHEAERSKAVHCDAGPHVVQLGFVARNQHRPPPNGGPKSRSRGRHNDARSDRRGAAAGARLEAEVRHRLALALPHC